MEDQIIFINDIVMARGAGIYTASISGLSSPRNLYFYRWNRNGTVTAVIMYTYSANGR